MRKFVFSLLALALTLGAYAGEEQEPKPAKPAPEKAGEGDAKPEGEKTEEVKNKAPDFTLPGVDGKKHSLSGVKGKWVVLEWINHGCPYVKKHYDAGTIQRLQKKYAAKGVVWYSICSSAEGKQGHMSVEQWKKVNAAKGSLATAVLLDPSGDVGRKYNARVTPQMFIVNPKGGIAYDGAIDDRPRAFRPEQIAEAKNYVEVVLDAVLAGKEPPVAQTRPYG